MSGFAFRDLLNQYKQQADTIAAIEAENKRLREALERIEQICNGAWSHESITHIASGALAGSPAANEEQQ